jgi:hypothetical protein
MTAALSIRVTDFTGGPFAVSATDGQALYAQIAPVLAVGKRVSVSFAGVEVTMGAFLNAAFGALCESFSDDTVRDLVAVGDLSPDGCAATHRSIQNARRYYTHRAAYDAAWAEEMGEQHLQQEATTP